MTTHNDISNALAISIADAQDAPSINVDAPPFTPEQHRAALRQIKRFSLELGIASTQHFEYVAIVYYEQHRRRIQGNSIYAARLAAGMMSLNEAYEIEANREGYIEGGDQALVNEAEAVIEEQRIREYDECVTQAFHGA